MPIDINMLQNVSDDFLVFAKSYMDEKLQQGILVGKPLFWWFGFKPSISSFHVNSGDLLLFYLLLLRQL
jgi:hypothetical protein